MTCPFLERFWEDKRYYSNTSPQPLHPGNLLAGWSKAAAASVPREPWSSGLLSLTAETRTEEDHVYPTSACQECYRSFCTLNKLLGLVGPGIPLLLAYDFCEIQVFLQQL